MDQITAKADKLIEMLKPKYTVVSNIGWVVLLMCNECGLYSHHRTNTLWCNRGIETNKVNLDCLCGQEWLKTPLAIL